MTTGNSTESPKSKKERRMGDAATGTLSEARLIDPAVFNLPLPSTATDKFGERNS